MTLTKEQIQYLFDFTRKKYVRYYDVQVELVDHLASAIEDKMQSDPNISFDKALSEVYSGFGITGFSKVVAQKQSAMSSLWRRRILRYMYEYFTLPKIVITVLLTTIIYKSLSFLSLIQNPTFFFPAIGVLIIALCFGLIIFSKKRFSIVSGEKMLTIEAFYYQIFWPLHLGFQMLIFAIQPSSQLSLSMEFKIGISILLSAFFIYSYAMIFVFPDRLRKEVEDNYPEFMKELELVK